MQLTLSYANTNINFWMIAALDAEIHNQRSEYMGVIDDINDLRILLGSISSFEDS